MERNYEIMLILRPDLSDSEREEVFQRILKKAESLGGNVSGSKIWADQRNLCYPLKSRGAERKKYTKGCYWLVNLTLDTEKLPDLKETLRLEERILRNLVINKEGQMSVQLS